jgi:hypothetical protein
VTAALWASSARGVTPSTPSDHMGRHPGGKVQVRSVGSGRTARAHVGSSHHREGPTGQRGAYGRSFPQESETARPAIGLQPLGSLAGSRRPDRDSLRTRRSRSRKSLAKRSRPSSGVEPTNHRCPVRGAQAGRRRWWLRYVRKNVEGVRLPDSVRVLGRRIVAPSRPRSVVPGGGATSPSGRD